MELKDIFTAERSLSDCIGLLGDVSVYSKFALESAIIEKAVSEGYSVDIMAATTISSFSGKSALLSYFRFVVPRTSARLKDYAGQEVEGWIVSRVSASYRRIIIKKTTV